METIAFDENMVYDATIIKHENYGVYVMFRLTPDSEPTEGFIIGSNLKLYQRDFNLFTQGNIPKHLKINKEIKVSIIRTDGKYYDLRIV